MSNTVVNDDAKEEIDLEKEQVKPFKSLFIYPDHYEIDCCLLWFGALKEQVRRR